jgi:hypothetical protein
MPIWADTVRLKPAAEALKNPPEKRAEKNALPDSKTRRQIISGRIEFSNCTRSLQFP